MSSLFSSIFQSILLVLASTVGVCNFNVLIDHKEFFYTTKRQQNRFKKYLKKDGTIRVGRFKWWLNLRKPDRNNSSKGHVFFKTLLISKGSRGGLEVKSRREKKLYEHELAHKKNYLILQRQILEVMKSSCWMSNQDFNRQVAELIRQTATKDAWLDISTNHGKTGH